MKTFRRIYSFIIKTCPLEAIFVVIISMVTAFCVPYSFTRLEVIIDDLVFNSYNVSHILVYAGFLLGITFLNWLQNILKEYIKVKAGHKFASSFIKHTQRIAFENFENEEQLNLMTLIGNNPEQHILRYFSITLALVSSLIQGITILFMFINAKTYLGIAYIVFLIIIVIFDSLAMRRMNKMFEHQSEKERYATEYERHLYDRQSLFILTIFRAINFFKSRVNFAIDDILDERIKTTKRAQVEAIFSRIASVIWFAGTLAALIFLFYNKNISLGVFVTLTSALTLATASFESFSTSFSESVRTQFYCKKTYQFLDITIEIIDENNEPQKADSPFLQFENITFKYPNAKEPLLKNFSLTIFEGEHTALVGCNGSGKSTILKLILRLYRPQQGRILLKGKNINIFTQNELSQIFGVVFQDFAHFELSIREIVSLGNLENLDNDFLIEKALDIAGVSQFSKENYDNELGKLTEESVEISEGQWQRLAIARALFNKKQFILFDEALASIDPVAEAKMYNHLNTLLKGCGALLISHRMGTCLLADRIIVLENGKIIEDGNHDELIKQDGRYKYFYNEQSEWYKGGTELA